MMMITLNHSFREGQDYKLDWTLGGVTCGAERYGKAMFCLIQDHGAFLQLSFLVSTPLG